MKKNWISQTLNDTALMLLEATGLLAVATLLLQLVRPSSVAYAQTGLALLLGIWLAGLIMAAWRAARGSFTAVSRWIAAGSVAAAFFVLVPVTIERSVSVFLLQGMSEGESYSGEELSQLLSQGYLCRQKAVDKRMHEQERLGIIIYNKEKFELTGLGRSLAGNLGRVGSWFAVPEKHPWDIAKSCR